jgi:hypothetical protein
MELLTRGAGVHRMVYSRDPTAGGITVISCKWCDVRISGYAKSMFDYRGGTALRLAHHIEIGIDDRSV